jgi:hypothetical protein
MRFAAVLASALATACATDGDSATDCRDGKCDNAVPAAVDGRADLEVRTYKARITRGLSDELIMELPGGLQSMLIEVRASKGHFTLATFETPSGDPGETGMYKTSNPRGIPGLVSWLYPNSPDLKPIESGTHKLVLRGELETGGPLDGESVEVRIYTKKQTASSGCMIPLGLLVDPQLLKGSVADQVVDSALGWIQNLYAQVGIEIADSQLVPVTLPAPTIDPTAVSQLEQLVDQSTSEGVRRSARVVLAKTIGGPAGPLGYSMGLPGPFDGDRPDAAVLAALDPHAQDSVLDVDGLASTIAHELGHYFGLYDTTDPSSIHHDPIADTPRCEDSIDCSPEFEQNIMSPGFGAKRSIVTPGQAAVIRNHPLCEPK